MTDYRQPAHRLSYHNQLWELNLRQGIMPGLVYLYMPELATRQGWNGEQRLWFAFINGLTQNPATSLVIMNRLPEPPRPGSGQLLRFAAWFDEHWDRLAFDTDRRYQKKDTVAALEGYARQAEEAGGLTRWATGTWRELWVRARAVPTFGRLSAWSYLEYVRIAGYGAEPDTMMFADRDGSRSHRNGMLMLRGLDSLVIDRRMKNGFDGVYADFPDLCARLEAWADRLILSFGEPNPGLGHAGRFTLESNLCTFKNHFFGRRYPGVYADMAWDRILRADAAGWGLEIQVLKDIRNDRLPEWLRTECEAPGGPTPAQRGAVFPETGRPFRGDNFLEAA